MWNSLALTALPLSNKKCPSLKTFTKYIVIKTMRIYESVPQLNSPIKKIAEVVNKNQTKETFQKIRHLVCLIFSVLVIVI